MGETAPELRVDDWIGADGQPRAPWRLADHQGRLRVIFCFQSWCPGCHSTGFPTLQQLHRDYAGQGVEFAVIQTVFEGHAENGPEQRAIMQQRYELALPLAQDDAHPHPHTMSDYHSAGTPWWILINRQGRVIYNHFQWPIENARRTLNALLAASVKPGAS